VTRQEFENLARKLEQTAANRMSSYRGKVALLAAAGYLYIFLVLGLILAALLLMLGVLAGGRLSGGLIKLAIPLVALAYTVLRALWVRWPDPDGIPVSLSEAPRLFAEVEAIRARLRAPRVHRIFIDDRFNAAMEQRPLLGVFGWPQGYMHIGLPLMLALSPDEFRAVLAHELGHLSGNHGRMSGWIYRIRQTWMQLLQRLEQDGRWGSGVFTKFFGWYAPFLNAYSFVLARAQEYEADQHAAEIAGGETTARALVAMDVRGKFLEESFWRSLWKTANDSPVPPTDLYGEQRTALREPFSAMGVRRWVRQSLSVKTGYVDTHPSLADRVRALGVRISEEDWASRIGAVARPSAAEEMLGSSLDAWFRRFHERWHNAVAASWSARHKQVQELRGRLADLKAKGASSSLQEEETWEAARLSGDLEGDDAAAPFYEEILRGNAGHVSANFEMGRILLLRGESSGVDHLERAMKGDPDCTYTACSIAEQYMRERGKQPEAEGYHNRAMQFLDTSDEAEKERQNITAADTFISHDVDGDILKQIRAHFPRYVRLKAAFLVRKSVRFFPEKGAYVLGIVPMRAWYQFSGISQDDVQLMQLIAEQTPLPAGTYVMLLNQNRPLRKKIEIVSGSQIYGT
jgi:Zn-dependent protease with chaperone function